MWILADTPTNDARDAPEFPFPNCVQFTFLVHESLFFFYHLPHPFSQLCGNSIWGFTPMTQKKFGWKFTAFSAPCEINHKKAFKKLYIHIYLYMLILVDRANLPSIVKNRDSGKVKRRWRDTGCGSGADRQKAARCFIDIFCLLIWNTAKSKIYNLKSLTMLEKKRIVNYSKHMIKST